MVILSIGFIRFVASRGASGLIQMSKVTAVFPPRGKRSTPASGIRFEDEALAIVFSRGRAARDW
jgi:hypothetical protein